MIIESLRLKGYLSFIEEEFVDFTTHHILLFSGKNGEGKSALLEAIPFCFWGEGRGKKLSDYINDHCDTLRIEVIFISENARYRKLRQYGQKGNINELYIDRNQGNYSDANWKLLSDDTKRKTDELLSSIIGLDYSLFCNSVFFGQKEASSFIEGEASDRKELLCNLLDIQIYEQAEEEAKNRIKNIDSQLQSRKIVLADKKRVIERNNIVDLDYKTALKNIKKYNEDINKLQIDVESCDHKIEELKIEQASNEANREKLADIATQMSKIESTTLKLTLELKKIDEEMNEKIDEGINEIEKLQDLVDKEKDLLQSKDDYEKKLKTIKFEKDKIPSIKVRLESYRGVKEKCLQQQSEFSTILKTLNAKKEKIKKSGAVCPITEEQCDKLTKENKDRMIKDLDLDIDKNESSISRIQKELEEAKEKIIEFSGEIDAISKRTERESSLASSLAKTTSELQQVETAKELLPKMKIKYRTAVDNLTKSKENLEKTISESKEEYEMFVEKKEKLSSKLSTNYSENIKKLKKQSEVILQDIKDLIEQKNEFIAESGRLKSEIELIKQAAEDAKTMQEEISKLDDDMRVYTELSVAFGKNGIQKDIIVNNVPILEEKTNELLAMFCKNNHLLVKFDLDPITSSGKAKKRGGLDIIIYQNGNIPRPLNMYSGGETVRIVFAILLSLSYLLTKRAGKNSQTLIIDERVAALDQEGVNQFIEIVNLISSQYKKIFIVSHISELKEAFSDVMTVRKDANGSKVTINN